MLLLYSFLGDYYDKFCDIFCTRANTRKTSYNGKLQYKQTNARPHPADCINVIQNVPVSSVRLITVSVITYQINKTVFGILLILAALYIVFFEIFKGKLYNTTREFKNEQALFFSKAQEQLRYIKFVKRHGLIDVFINRVDLAFQSLFKTAMHAQIFQYIFSGIDSMLLALSQIGLFLVGGVAVLNGEMSIGGFTTINVYFSSALGCIRYFFSLTSSTQNALVSLNRLMDVAKMQSESDGKQIVSNIKAIYLQDISLSFDKPVLKSFNAAFYKGNIYALCGDNGTGKSSVLHLVAGLYNNLYGGNIYFDDFDIKKLNMNFLRKSLMLSRSRSFSQTKSFQICIHITLMKITNLKKSTLQYIILTNLE